MLRCARLNTVARRRLSLSVLKDFKRIETSFCRAISITALDYRKVCCPITDIKSLKDNNSDRSVLTTSPRKEHFLKHAVNRIQALVRAILDALYIALRSGEIVIRFSPLIVLVPAAMYTNKSNKISDMSWSYALHQISALGPAYIKLTQLAATRRDLFPSHVCNRLGKLHDSAFVHSWSHTHQVLSAIFGKDYENILSLNQTTIIGSGSIAQVYRGILKRDGVDHIVAVKVLHPSIHRKVDRDIDLMKRIASFVHSIPSDMIRMVNLPKATANFADIIRRQLDLRLECQNLRIFQHHFQHIEQIGFPVPIIADTHCLVESYEGSTPIKNFISDDSEKGFELRRKLAAPLLRAFLKMVFIDNFVHCDLHPGNVLVKSTSNPGEYKIVFLDAGIVTELNKKDLQNLKDLFKAVILNDGEKCGRLMVERAAYERCSQVEGGVEAFAKGIGDIVSEFHDRRKEGLILSKVRVANLLSRVLDQCRIHGVEIDPAMSNIVVSTLMLEGLGRSLDAGSNLMDFALPFLLTRQ